LWLGRTSGSAEEAVNSVFTKFLKRYLGIPYRANNSITYFITNSEPLTIILQQLYQKSFSSLTFPTCTNGYKLSQTVENPEQYDPLPLIPSHFWRSKYPGCLPLYARSRSALCHEIFDLNHFEYCMDPSFHVSPDENCFCVACGDPATYYHPYFCACIQ